MRVHFLIFIITDIKFFKRKRAINFKNLIKKHQTALEAAASIKTKLWWEKYMKGVISFRGTGIPKNRELLAVWRKENALERWSVEKQLDLAMAFFKEPIAEDKLAGILYLENYLLDEVSWELLFAKFETVYEKKFIFDWNICDWFCIKVLGPLIDKHGKPFVQAITEWNNSAYLWQARSSAVPFVYVENQQQYYPQIRKTCSILIKREERFAKTAVGWLLREISKQDPDFVEKFVKKHAPSFSKESMKNALKYFDKNKIQAYLQLI